LKVTLSLLLLLQSSLKKRLKLSSSFDRVADVAIMASEFDLYGKCMTSVQRVLE
jgi:hypothetical protein